MWNPWAFGSRDPPISWHNGANYPFLNAVCHSVPQSQNEISGHRPNIVGNGHKHFFLDSLCHPTRASLNVFTEACHKPFQIHGGYFDNGPVLRSDGTHLVSDGAVQHKCHCVCHNHLGSKCQFRGQIRAHSNKTHGVFTRPHCKSHDHPVSDRPSAPKDQFGLHPAIVLVAEECFSHPDRCALRVNLSVLLAHVVDKVNCDPACLTHRHIVKDIDFLQHLKKQLHHLLAQRRLEYIEGKLNGVSHITNCDVLVRALRLFELKIPEECDTQGTTLNPSLIAKNLKLPTDCEMIIHDLSSGPLVDKFRDVVVPQTPAKQLEFRQRTEFSFFVCSPQTFSQLGHFCKRRKGTRALSIDGTCGLNRDKSPVISIGCNSVRCRSECDKVTSSFRAMAHLRAGGERMCPALLMLHALRMLAWKLFRLELEIDWGESDRALTFVNSCVMFKNYPSLLDSVHRQQDPLANVRTISLEEAACLTADERELNLDQRIRALFASGEVVPFHRERQCSTLFSITGDQNGKKCLLRIIF